MLFFKKKKNTDFKLELLSLHIPKTAGTSFRNILKSVYGEEAVLRFDIDPNLITRVNEIPYNDPQLPNAKVLHGHFNYLDIQKKFDIPKDVKIITWLRDPVSRVISNFYYLESILKNVVNEKENNLNILSKMQRSLIEYARDEVNTNRQAKFLNGLALKDIHFIGIQENFNDDLKLLSEKLDWPIIPDSLYVNKTPVSRPKLSRDILEEIKSLNQADFALYNEALDLRNLTLV